MVREIVVILDRLKRYRFAEEAEMVDGDWSRKEEGECCEDLVKHTIVKWKRRRDLDRMDALLRWVSRSDYLPSTMPRPERRTGTREMREGSTTEVVYV